MAEVYLLLQDLITQTEDDSIDRLYQIHKSVTKKKLVFSVVSCLAAKRRHIARVKNCVENVIPQYTPDDFKNRFRMSRSTFDALVLSLSPQLAVGLKGGIMKVSIETTVHTSIHQTSSIICSDLLPALVKWPSGMKVLETVDMFFQHKGFPGVLGAIDGLHIPIKTPKVDGEQYYNRKKFPSIILQAVCDKNLHFLDFYCGWPGSVHDSRVLKNSPLFTSAFDNKERMFPGNTHLIGDAAYALSQWVMTPFKDFGNLSAEQKRYNYIHSSSRMCIDRAFGALKGRFRRLRYIDMKDMPEVVKFVLSCCTLHEVCLANFDEFDEYIAEGLNANEEINDFQDFLRRRPSAQYKRQSIVDMLG
ncbi:putative nuclease HARBI1 [Mytilus edulis]|uniref:putative nuclease HARBI1 n=1 Tax=Mytilus edulis TaxID=6550 RepID=UPI0039F1433A